MPSEPSNAENPAWFTKSPLGQSIITRMRNGWPESTWQSVTVVVAVSGGADSVALLRVLDWLKRNADQTAAGRLVVASFDHGWRDDANEDVQFVTSLARTLGWECVAGRAPKSSASAKSENNARELRYQFLQAVAADSGARYIVTGHTANDQAETVLHRIVRGTGLQGLAGVPSFRVINESLTIARPLLGVWREELVEMLAAIDQPFRVDKTNQDETFTRNRIRQKLMPELREDYNSEADAALVRLSQLASEVQFELAPRIANLLEHCEFLSKYQVAINLSHFATASPLIVREAFRRIWKRQSWPQQSMGFAEWQRLEQMSRDSAQEKTATLPGNVAVVFKNGRMVLRRRNKD